MCKAYTMGIGLPPVTAVNTSVPELSRTTVSQGPGGGAVTNRMRSISAPSVPMDTLRASILSFWTGPTNAASFQPTFLPT